MTFKIDALRLDEKPTEKVSAKLTKTRKGELDALVKQAQEAKPDVSEEEIIEKLIGIGLDSLRTRGAGTPNPRAPRSQGGDRGLSTSSTAVED